MMYMYLRADTDLTQDPPPSLRGTKMRKISVRLHEKLPDLQQHKVWAEIDTSALKYNFRTLQNSVRSYLPGTDMIAVVKADAYGHGIAPCSIALYEEGCRHFAVSCIDEAIALREVLDTLHTDTSAEATILILGYTIPEQAYLLAKYRIATALLSPEYARELDRSAKAQNVRVDVHIALDTGMNRIGFSACFDSENIRPTIEEIAKVYQLSGLRVQGLFTHFARADEKQTEVMKKSSHVMTQYSRYLDVVNGLAEIDLRPPVCHVCNSAAAMRFPEAAASGNLSDLVNGRKIDGFDAVRLGIMLYGVRPSEYVPCKLRPVMKLCTVITHINTLHPGESVSYGGTFISDTQRTIATLPIGYADGFVRAFSGADVTVHTSGGDFRVPIVGRICMDQCMIDITNIPCEVKLGDVVTMFGIDPSDLEALSARAGTIEYESLCLISARVARIVI